MTRKPLMAGNWKMNCTIGEACVLAQEINNRFDKNWDDRVDVVLLPPFVDLKPVKTVVDFDRMPIAIGAQNCFWEPSGAYTGEISIPMLKEIGCKYCVVGHSERREIFGETNEMVNKKVKALLAAGLTPIICVGESLGVRDSGDAIEYVGAQVDAALAGLTPAEVAKCVMGYEPVWAIGTGRTATPEIADETCGAIRAKIAELFGADVAEGIRILYGGSMKPENVDMLIAQPNIDGGLVGGAALKATSFIDLIKACL